MLRYIMGRAGCGKSRQVLGEIKQAMDMGADKPLILLVPEQYTLQAERDLVEKLQLKGIMQVEVLSFTRMASRVFSEVGGLTRVLINEQGKNMVLRRVINQNIKSLTIYRQAAKQFGFISKCGQMISELKQYDIPASMLRDRLEQIDNESILAQKMRDITLIYEAFNDYLQDRYLDMEDYINLFIDKLGQSRYFSDARIWIDNFTTFSPQSLRIIDRLIPLTADLTISLTRDDQVRKRDQELFMLSDSTYRKLHAMAIKWGIREENVEYKTSQDNRVKSPELKHLEQELYAYPYRTWELDSLHIHIFAAANTASEVEYLAARLVSLARDKGWRWRETAVVCQDINTYGPIIKRVFHEYRIPYFMDEKREIIDHPIMQFILSSLDILQRNYRHEDICRCCKTGFTMLNQNESEELENYMMGYGIHGKRLKEDFLYGEPSRLAILNGVRIRLMQPLLNMEEKLASAVDLAGMTRILHEYLEELKIADRLAAEIEVMHQRGWLEMVRESTQIWNIVIDTLDQIYTMMGDQPSTLKEYRQLLEAGFLSYELGIIPTTVDQVLVGAIQRSKSQDIRALFVLGFNDGILPAGRSDDSLLAEHEKNSLESYGLEIGLNRDMMIAQENYLIYNAFSKPGEDLWLSYALADAEGRALRPSLLLTRIRHLYKKLETSSDLIEDYQTGLDSISTPGSTIKYLVRNLRRGYDGRTIEDFWWDAFNWYQENDVWQEKLNLIARGFAHCNQVDNLNPALAARLYPRPFRTSVSRLEQYVNCPFAHFIRYGMRPSERKTFEVSAPDIGELFHGAFLNLAEKITEQGINWQELQRDQCESLMDSVMEEMVPGHADGVFSSTHRYRYLVNRLKRIGRRSAWTITQHIQAGEFRPMGYELRFGIDGNLPPVEIVLENEETLYLEGRIDRADIYEEGDDTYVRVIDYKTGGKTFNLSDAYYGLSLQLLVYLKALLAKTGTKSGSNLKPAGILYFKIDDPAVKSDEEVQEEIEKRIARELRMNGLVLKDVNIVRAMDREMDRNSNIIPVGLKKDGNFDLYSAVLDEDEFTALLNHTESILRQITDEMVHGRARIEPVMIEQRKACDYCSYQSICQFDQLFDDNRYRRLPRLNRGEVIEKIMQPQSERGEG